VQSRPTHPLYDDTWGKWGTGQNMVMSKVSSRRPDSVASSEAGITDGITVTKKIDYSESVEDAESDKDRSVGHAQSTDNVV
jgi:hypothetical protein